MKKVVFSGVTAQFVTGGNKIISSLTTSSQSVQLPTTGELVAVYNLSSTNWVFVTLGDSNVTATTADLPIPPSGVVWMSRSPVTETHLASIANAGLTNTVYAVMFQGSL